MGAVSALGFVLVINSSWKPTPDAALYVALGESLARGEGYLFNGEPHTFVPPGYPLILAGVAHLFGNSFLAYRILMAIMGLLAAVAGYLFVRRLCGRDTALLAGGLFALNHVLLYNSTFTLADVPFALFTLIALQAILAASVGENRVAWTIAAAVLTGILPLIRINGLGVPLAASFFLYCSWKHEMKWSPRLCLLVLFLLLAFAPAGLWEIRKASFPASFSEGSYMSAIVGRKLSTQLLIMLEALRGYVPETSYAMTGVVLKTGFLEFLAPVLALVGAVTAWRNGDRLLVPLAAVQYAGFLLSPAGSRYLIVLIPALYLFLALGILRIWRWICRKVSASRARALTLVGFFSLLALLNVGHNVKTIVSARSAIESNGAETERGLPFYAAARWLKANAPRAIVLTTHPRITHYLSGCPTVTLVRSGFPEHEVWVKDSHLIQRLITERNPQFLFADSRRAALYQSATDAIHGLGMELKEIPIGVLNSRYRLFRIVSPDGPDRGSPQ